MKTCHTCIHYATGSFYGGYCEYDIEHEDDGGDDEDPAWVDSFAEACEHYEPGDLDEEARNG